MSNYFKTVTIGDKNGYELVGELNHVHGYSNNQ